ncbi:hypothetical protein [Arthrobacter sp. CJ23]|uniref:hypothetical protein n=1 Tax=Arthrobacter sp. CJ23 TaxID=2972479 RepID=UPI00215B93A8|nr:hypothetical protein [Arthrobacter sp. CJ23]UVJ39574.1 hypothetical protein NVV90_20655 [Arthrobacter sp. CJ23]
MALLIRDGVTSALGHTPTHALSRRPSYFDVGLAVSGLAAAVLILLDVGGAPLAAFKLVVCLALPGWVALSRLPGLDLELRLVWTAAASAVVCTTLALVMAWTGFWHPRPVAAVVVLASAALIIFVPGTLARDPGRPGPRPNAAGSAEPYRGSRFTASLPWLILAAAAAMWVAGLATTGQGRLGDFGLLPELPPLWYLAVGIVVGTCVWGVVARKMFSKLLMSVSVSSLVVMLYASAGLLAQVPRFPWTYKHIAVTNFITATGHVDPSVDIYNRWPGFFALSAYLGEVMGYRNALDYAAWAETGFALVDAVLVLAIARIISDRARVYWTTTLIFTLANWVNQNYYSPQSYSYSLYLAMCLVALTFLKGIPAKWMVGFEHRLRHLRMVREFKKRRPGALPRTWERPVPAMQILACVAILLAQAVIVVSHQLTPYIAVLGLFPLFISGYLRPRWLGPALLLLPLAYLIPNFAYVSGKYGLFSGFNIFANTGYRAPRTDQLVLGQWVLTGHTLAHLAVVLTLATGVLAVAGFVRRLLHGHVRTTLVVAWLAVSPALGLLAQSYGGEARFRVFLFALPWLSIGVAWLFWSGPIRTRKAVVGAGSALVAMAMMFTVVHFQPEADYRVSKDDVVASQWLDAHTTQGDLVYETKYFFPLLVGPNYPHYLQWGSVTSLVEYLNAVDGKVSMESLRQYSDHLRGAKSNYIVFSDEQKRQAIEQGLFEAYLLPKLENVLAKGDGVANVFSNSTVRIYKFEGTG